MTETQAIYTSNSGIHSIHLVIYKKFNILTFPFYNRLVQNRKSAQKCRLKKKAEFQTYKEDVNKLSSENKELKEKVRYFKFVVILAISTKYLRFYFSVKPNDYDAL